MIVGLDAFSNFLRYSTRMPPPSTQKKGLHMDFPVIQACFLLLELILHVCMVYMQHEGFGLLYKA